MSRLLCLILLSLGLAQTAIAEENGDHMSAYLTQKFGLAKEKAQKISDAVQSAASKYSLPPALLLAIISIESRFKEKAKGANGATGLMQVVPSAHRGLLRNVKDLTEPTANIEVGSAILYGYMRSANGDMNAALRNYGGSQAYAQKVSLRAGDFADVGTPQDIVKPVNAQADMCDARAADRCPVTGNWSNAFTIPSVGAVGAASAAGAGLNGAVSSTGLPPTSN
ncbi:transglycosylase SLT domain-containing protein [Paraburkholderia rhynchosiae]|nr:transglycosylase SLT domain-containing protein [Paraburkholderia rhynchosiae]PMS24481.1 lytic transglycosylase [Paraburkholderia rhynchosiae]